MTAAFPHKWVPETRRVPYIRFTLLWVFSTLRIRPELLLLLLLLLFFFYIRDTGTLGPRINCPVGFGPPSLRQRKFLWEWDAFETTQQNGGLLGGLHLTGVTVRRARV